MVPELLAPAGSLDKLKIAVDYGANAVYIGGQKYGLRSRASNFTLEEIAEARRYTTERSCKLFVVLNSFFHDSDFEGLLEFVTYLDQLAIDAVIVSDPGVIKVVRENTSIDIHLSTQSSCLNSMSALAWKKLGVKRVVLGREVSISEAALVKENSGLEVEIFIHGSMCMAYSGHCVISNYTQGRDSNRGGCAHSCRFEYGLKDEKESEKRNSFFMSSKDLMGVSQIPQVFAGKIDSLKIEGRMKTHLYAATVTKIYRQAIDHWQENKKFNPEDIRFWEDELQKFSHRSYTQASLISKAGPNSVYDEREHEESDYAVAGVVLEACPDSHCLIEVRKAFEAEDVLEFLPFQGAAIAFRPGEMCDLRNRRVERSKPGTLIKIPFQSYMQANQLIRNRVFSL